MDQATDEVRDEGPTKLEFKTLEDWENVWKKGFAGWHIDFVDPYVKIIYM